MENKKILKILINDLSELEELVAEKNTNSFDELELDFLKARINGVKKLAQILSERENVGKREFAVSKTNEIVEEVEQNLPAEVEENKMEDVPVEEVHVAEKQVETLPKETKEIVVEAETEPVKREQNVVEDSPAEIKTEEPEVKDFEEFAQGEEVKKEGGQRLGDSFRVEKSVNDLINTELNNLEHKLSTRPVSSIQTAIGINDRFQYIRELFDGNAEKFSETVSSLDAMKNINEAVNYLQTNFNWKKNDASLKFVGLVKRRFPNE